MMTRTAILAAALAAALVLPSGVRAAPPREVLDRTYLYEIVRYLYRWQLDEKDLDGLVNAKVFPFWVGRLEPKLDAGDRSEYAEIILPLVNARVKVKKADYRIEETGTEVKSRTFRVVNVARGDLPAEPGPGWVVAEVEFAAMRAYLFDTRFQAEFPDDALQERARLAMRRQMGLAESGREGGRQIAHLAPLSPVANEWWVFWETGKQLFRIASDIDLTNPAVWEHETLSVRTYDVLNQVVVSLDEVAGSNAFMTRDQIGRALYNCVILGKRFEVENPAPPPATP